MLHEYHVKIHVEDYETDIVAESEEQAEDRAFDEFHDHLYLCDCEYETEKTPEEVDDEMYRSGFINEIRNGAWKKGVA